PLAPALTDLPAAPPRPPLPPAGFRPTSDGRPPVPPPPQHAQPPAQFRHPYGPPQPEVRFFAGLPAPPPPPGSPPAGLPAAPQPYPPPPHYGQPWYYGQSDYHGQPLSPRYLPQPDVVTGDGPPAAGAQPGSAPAAPPGDDRAWPLAGFRARVISFLIDSVAPLLVVAVLLGVGFGVGSPLAAGLLAAVALILFYGWNSGYRQGSTGQSIGRRVAGTKLVKIDTGAPVGFGLAVLRQLCHGLEFGLGYLWPLWDEQRQTVADKIVGTVVVGVDPAAGPRPGSSSPPPSP
ncbi:MAG TPA: RDD family protein, partial [Pseudonocardiaceae bacterium]|nr:RDD family protein [Pseudonocardiaceae bacterium]